MARDRGIEHVERYFGNFLRLVESKINEKGKVRILEAGCGHGVAMIGFIKKFGNKVEMVGFNYSKLHGNSEKMKKEAIKKKIFTKQELKKIKNLPRCIYCDTSKKLPFKDNEFDFIYSMASIYLFEDKIHFLEECNRILKKEGIARISPSFGPHFRAKKGFPSKYYEMWEIWDKGKEVKIWNYTKRIKGVNSVWRNREKKEGDKPMYIEIKKQSKLNFKLKLISSIDYNFLWKKWIGIKSVYTTQLNFSPHWKK